MAILKVDMLPGGSGVRIRTHTYEEVDSWGYFFDGEFVEIIQGLKTTHIPVHRIERIVQIDCKVLNMVK